MDAQSLLQRYAQMRTDRASHESVWQKIARVLRPLRQNINQVNTTPGERRYERIYDSSPLMALDNFKAGLYGMMTNPAFKWFDIRRAGQEAVDEGAAVKHWLAVVAKRIRYSFGPGVSGFYNQVPAMYADIGAFGSGIFFSREIVGQARFHDVTVSLEEAYFSENEWGEVDTVCRAMRPTARQAVGRFGEACSKQVQDAARITPDTRFDFLHFVLPNPDYEPGRIGPRGMRYASFYVEQQVGKIVLEEGFSTFPYQCARWDVAAGETYGRSQGEIVLADTQSLQSVRRTNLTAMERAANPTLLAPDENSMPRGVHALPGSTIYGGMTPDGKRRVDILAEGKNVAISLEMENMLRNSIKDAFYFGLMQISGSTDMTATEYLGREQERLRLLGPHLGRIESEFLTPLIRRRFSLLNDMGGIPPAPDEIADAPLEIQYVSPLARMQRTQEAEAALRAVQGMMMAAQTNPEVMDRLDPDAFAEVLDEGFGSGILRSREDGERVRAAREQAQQQAMMMQQAPGLARAGRDVAEMGSALNGG